MNALPAGQDTHLEGILERNRAFVARREAAPLPPVEPLGLAVVACYDPRLDALLPAALGLDPAEAFLFRAAGALVQPTGATLRSLALAVYMFGVREILVVGHTSCRMAAFRNGEFVEAFRRRGVAREAFGAEDLREWAGAIPDPRRGVQISLANIAQAAFLPRDITLAGAVLDDTTGALEVVARPGELRVAAAAPAPSPAEPAAAEPAPADAPPPATAPPPAPESGELGPAVDELARVLQSTQRWRGEVDRLKQQIAREQNPLAKYRLIEALAQRAAGESREARRAFEQLKRAATEVHGSGPRELLELLRRLLGKP